MMMTQELMEIMPKLLTVMSLGAVELWAAIPAGFALQLPPVITGLTAASGSMLGAIVVVLLGDRIRGWLLRHHDSKSSKAGKPGLIDRIWQRYGVMGLGLLAPLLIGTPVGAAVGLTLGVPARRLLWWLSLGIVLWSIVLTIAGIFGLAGFNTLRH
jgi:membrane protein DedA with SNARE-associated domain